MTIKLKEIIFVIIVIVFAVIFWYVLKNLIYNGFLLKKFAFTFPFFILFSISFLICLVLLKNKYLFLLNSFLIILLPVLFFELNIFYFIFGIFIVSILFIGFLKIENLKKSQIKVDFSEIIQKSSVYFLNSIILVILVIFYYSPYVRNIEKFELPRFLSDTILKFSQPIIQNYLPGFDLGKSIEESILNFYFQSAQLPKDFSNLKYQDLIKMPQVQSLIQEQKFLLEKETGIKIKEDEKINDIVYNLFNKKIQEFALKNPTYFKLTLVLILFSILKIFIWPIKYLVLFLMAPIFKSFLLLKIIKIEKQAIEKEVLVV